MSETTIPNDSATTNGSRVRYARVESPQPTPPPASPPPQSQPPEPPAHGYVRAHRSADNSVIITYNAAEAHARAVRREISRLLND